MCTSPQSLCLRSVSVSSLAVSGVTKAKADHILILQVGYDGRFALDGHQVCESPVEARPDRFPPHVREMFSILRLRGSTFVRYASPRSYLGLFTEVELRRLLSEIPALLNVLNNNLPHTHDFVIFRLLRGLSQQFHRASTVETA